MLRNQSHIPLHQRSTILIVIGHKQTHIVSNPLFLYTNMPLRTRKVVYGAFSSSTKYLWLHHVLPTFTNTYIHIDMYLHTCICTYVYVAATRMLSTYSVKFQRIFLRAAQITPRFPLWALAHMRSHMYTSTRMYVDIYVSAHIGTYKSSKCLFRILKYFRWCSMSFEHFWGINNTPLKVEEK